MIITSKILAESKFFKYVNHWYLFEYKYSNYKIKSKIGAYQNLILMYLKALADLCWPNLNSIQNKLFTSTLTHIQLIHIMKTWLWINPNLYGGHISPDQPEGVGKYLLDS